MDTDEALRQSHVFLGEAHDHNARKTRIVIAICTVMMVAEIVGGIWFGSVALIADGLHMSTHAGALLIAAAAYSYARSHVHDPRFAFGTGKLGDLAGFASAVLLALIALLIGYESLMRVFQPVPIHYAEATTIATVGLVVNLLSAWALGAGHDHGHDHDHDHDDHHHDHDHNLRAAFFHVMADALTSVLAIAGLLAAWGYGWTWLDPAIGVVGALVIAHWSWRLIRDAGAVLLDAAPDSELALAIRTRLERGEDRIADLHVWRVGPGHHAAIVSLVSDSPLPVDDYKMRLADIARLSHVTVEVHRCNHSH
jgi:cation diffusion facilitator family transporter